MDERQESLIGGQFGDYRILSPLGSGGMGMVYAAEDTRLRRKVAIKFLADESLGDERTKQRLFHEARAAAALDHPNICTVYDVDEAHGQAFIVMQLVEGETLASRLMRGPLPLEQTLDIATQAVEALSAAHERGIVHRDIKPQNIIVSERGQVKVLDFGIAKMAPQFGDETVTASGLRTVDGAGAGTVPYMSPEQIRGEALDDRSDLFSLGIVLHELVSGARPFAGASSADTLAAILTKDPPPFNRPPGAPTSELERIVFKCLEKDRDLRYQSARELLADLRRFRRESSASAAVPRTVYSATRAGARTYVWVAAGLIVAVATGAAAWRWSTSSSEEIGAVAILPLTHVNVAPALDYQAETITGGLIDTLSRLPALKVMSRTAVQRYHGRATDAQTVGRELGVDAVVTGRLVGNGDALTLDLEIVNADDNSHIWGKQYQLSSANLLAVQREIPADLSAALRPGTRTSTSNAQRSTTDLEANRLYWLGRQSYYRYSQEATKLAVEYFNKAIARDPNYALAYSGLAQAYLTGSAGGLPPSEADRLGRAAAMKAIELDPNLSEAHSALALVLGHDWDFVGSDRESRRAIELNPNNVEAHHNYSHFLLGVGRTDEALAEARKVEEFDPVTDLALAHYAYSYLVVGQFDRSIEYFKKSLSLRSDPGSHLQLADAFYGKGMFKEAFDAALKGHKLNGLTGAELDVLSDAYAKRGMPGYFKARIAILEARGRAEPNLYPMASLGGQLASLYARLGDKDRAFQLLERMYNERDGACVSVREEVSFHVLHSDPRFADLLRRIGLPPV